MTAWRSRRALRRAFAATGATLLIAGCTFPWSGAGGDATGRSADRTPLGVPTGQEALASFYTQALSWQKCSGGECASYRVPLDYADPAGTTISIGVLRIAARGSAKGSLLLNPGGPGASGVDYARYANSILGRDLQTSFDIIGFDPRGVGRSAPVNCYDDAAMDAFMGAEPTPDTAAEESAFVERARAFAQACLAEQPEVIKHISTIETAKDMDILRSLLGDEKMNYLGASYGTLLGATYADLFPQRVGRFVLDGALPPDVSYDDLSKGQAKGFQEATRQFVGWCVDEGDCPLGDTEEAALARISSFLDEVDAAPLPVRGQGDVTELTEGWAQLGFTIAMYDENSWPMLEKAVRAALDGDGSDLVGLANYYVDRDSAGRYESNMMEAFPAISCLDQPSSADLDVIRRNITEFSAVSPTWGRSMAWGSVLCGVWPVHAAPPPAPARATGSDPIVVVGTTRDPATIYEWAVRLRDQLDNAVLITYEGDGHTAYQRGSSCVDDAVDRYFVDGVVPADNLTCQPG